MALGLVRRREAVYIGTALASLALISVALFYLSQGEMADGFRQTKPCQEDRQ